MSAENTERGCLDNAIQNIFHGLLYSGRPLKLKIIMNTKNVWVHELKKGDRTFYDAPMFSGWKTVEKVIPIYDCNDRPWIRIIFADGSKNDHPVGAIKPVEITSFDKHDYNALYGGY